jgi:hypothetical protein
VGETGIRKKEAGIVDVRKGGVVFIYIHSENPPRRFA